MWGTVSLAYGTLEKRRTYYLASAIEDRLAEQLSFLPTLQDWVPADRFEVHELTALLRAYVGAPSESKFEQAAAHLVEAIRTMARTRALLLAQLDLSGGTEQP